MGKIFKEGDRVFHIEYGWGDVITINEEYSFPVIVRFDNNDMQACFLESGIEFEDSSQSMLSFTEYTLQGFSQERPIDLPEVGEEVFYSLDDETWYLAKFKEYKNGDIILRNTFRTGMTNIFECNNIKRIR